MESALFCGRFAPVLLRLGRVGTAGALALTMGLCGGCASDLQKDVDGLKTELASLRAGNAALAERLDALEIANGGLKTGAAAPAPQPDAAPVDPNSPPDLRVVRLAPPDGYGNDEIEPSGSRVKIKSTAGGVVSEDAVGSAEVDTPASTAEFKKAKELYEKKKYDEALTAMQSFVTRYPESSKAPDATFYKGLAYAQKGETKSAAEAFEAVTKSYPRADVTPDALLELAKAREKLGETDAADKAKARLKKDFPKSAAAKKLAPSAGAKR